MSSDVDRALSELHEIQSRLAESTRFRGLAPDSNAMTALLALLVVVAQLHWPQALQPDALTFVLVWAGVLALSTAVVAVDVVSRTTRLHGSLGRTLLASAVNRALPFAAAMIVITCTVCSFAQQSLWLLPGLWFILIGLVGFVLVQSLPRAVVWSAVWYFGCGTAVLGLAGWSGSLSPWMMGVPLFFGQVGTALILNNAEREATDD